MDETPEDEALVLPLGRELDLHTFRPRDIASVVGEYLTEARTLGYEHVRLVHGKGIGFQRDVVRTVLGQTPFVVAFGDEPGNRGATWASLAPAPPR